VNVLAERSASRAARADTALPRIAARLFNTPLLVLPNAAVTIASNLAARFEIMPMAAPQALAPGGDDGDGRDRKPYEIVDGVAIISVRGELVNRSSWPDAYSGLVSYEKLGAALRAAAADPLVHSIVLDFDSPGDEAAGAMETAARVRAISRQKPVIAVVNALAASAAYAIAAGASKIVATLSAALGSIGVVWLHLDQSKALAEAGLKPTLLHAGSFKVDGNQLQPLAPDAKARIQSMIGSYYTLFTDSVGAHRPKLGAAGAIATEAGVYIGQAAVDAGLADSIGDMAGVIASLNQEHAAKVARTLQTKIGGSHKMAVEPYKNPAGSPADSLIEAAGGFDADSMARARAEGAKEERARIAAILRGPEAEGRAATAASFAFDTEMTAEQAVKALASVPKAEAPRRLNRLDAVVQRAGLSAFGDHPDGTMNDLERGRSAALAAHALPPAGRRDRLDEAVAAAAARAAQQGGSGAPTSDAERGRMAALAAHRKV
jgi:capsid assembly protease